MTEEKEKKEKNALLRSIPAMEELLNADWAASYAALMGREQVKRVVGEAIQAIRGELLGGVQAGAPTAELVRLRASALLQKRSTSTLKRVVNATGVVIHTNLGRSPLAREARDAVADLAGVYSTLEYAPEQGGRGSRNAHVEWLICGVTGAEAALVVNNNAAAVLLALSATAAGREVIVSNGELVEIGDSFRIPDILAFSGARMRAVGCTNATRLSDYQNAITEQTAALLKAHPSNYRVEGFVTSTSREELAGLAASRGLVFLEDLGSGLLCDLNVPFAEREHSVRRCLAAGSGVVTFSGDKLLGGPQIGVIAGSKPVIDRMRKHPLLRALRVDKLTLAAFEATLRLYYAGRHSEIPVIRMIELDRDALAQKAQRLCRLLRQGGLGSFDGAIEVVETRDAIGGGAFPTDELPGFAVALRFSETSGASGASSRGSEGVADALRAYSVPVIAGIRDGQVMLHVRTLLEGDEPIIAAALAAAFAGEG